jgi:hypothetical protein
MEVEQTTRAVVLDKPLTEDEWFELYGDKSSPEWIERFGDKSSPRCAPTATH